MASPIHLPIRIALASIAAAIGIPLFTPSPAHAQAGIELFEQQIRPILVKNCYACHSGSSPKAGLTLDSRAGILKGGNTGPAITPGDPETSLLIRAVRHSVGAPQMPPNAKLSDAEIAGFVRWIKLGAPDPRTGDPTAKRADHKPSWALFPLHKTNPPTVSGSLAAWVRTPIDRFIAARLLQNHLNPSPAADRRTLIRRATYDLTGLPPTPEEVTAFVADRSPTAYERLIDRLLASPRYGERWARHWLDEVHYGDTHGYDKDKRRDNAWPYRDYVIAAFNQDIQYSRFVSDQIAGDVLYPDDPQAAIATGMLAAGPWDFVGNVELAEATVEKEKTRLLDRDDVVSTVMSTFASVTIHCARCHDHKFDPIPQRDYYRLQAVFAGIDRGDRPYYDREHMALGEKLQRQRRAIVTRSEAVNTAIQALTSPAIQSTDDAIHSVRLELADVPAPAAPPAGGGSPSNGYHSDISSRQEVSRWVQVDLGTETPIDEIRLIPARPTDFKDTPGFGFPLRYRVSISSTSDFKSEQVICDRTQDDAPNPSDNPVVVSGGTRTARFVRVTASKLWQRTNDYVFALAELQVISANGINAAAGRPVTAQESIEAGRWSSKYLVDGFDSRSRLPDMTDSKTVAAIVKRDVLKTKLAELRAKRQDQVESLIQPATRSARTAVQHDLASIDAKIAAFPPALQVYAAIPHEPRPIWVLNRGDVEQHGEQVRPGALSCEIGLSSDFGPEAAHGEGQARAALAAWIVNPANTLTWRSIVNRVWQYHFTRGIVDTPNDFGNNGSKPSHPELLDWLACWFLQNGQSIKRLNRMIMLSSAYMQSSAGSAAGNRIDGDNRLLWRMNRRRLEAEEIRDSVLAVSGKLNLKMGGPGFELFRFKDDHSPIYDFSAADMVMDPATFRRTIYEFTVRSVPDPFLECLDAADPNALTPVRNSTLTALQALTMRNDPFIVSQSQFFAHRLASTSAQISEQIKLACRLLYGSELEPAQIYSLTTYASAYGMPNTCRLLVNTSRFMFVD